MIKVPDIQAKVTIEKIMNNIASKCGVKYPLADLTDFINFLGGTVQVDKNLTEFSSYFVKNEKSFTIFVPENLSSEESNLLLSHELGYIFLHLGFLSDSQKWDNANQEYKKAKICGEDCYVDIFAHAFIMPEEIFRKTIKDNMMNDKINIKNVAKVFHTTESAVIMRAKYLDILEPVCV